MGSKYIEIAEKDLGTVDVGLIHKVLDNPCSCTHLLVSFLIVNTKNVLRIHVALELIWSCSKITLLLTPFSFAMEQYFRTAQHIILLGSFFSFLLALS